MCHLTHYSTPRRYRILRYVTIFTHDVSTDNGVYLGFQYNSPFSFIVSVFHKINTLKFLCIYIVSIKSLWMCTLFYVILSSLNICNPPLLVLSWPQRSFYIHWITPGKTDFVIRCILHKWNTIYNMCLCICVFTLTHIFIHIQVSIICVI